ncbi:MAG TPA: site-specific integrase [Thermoanaerobaculia bacterium]|nr:site-specific integrase [Thermoanaerobaculia bacterium]
MRLPLLSDTTPALLDELTARFEQFLRRVEMERSPSTMSWYRNTFTIFRRYLEDAVPTTPEALHDRIQDLDAWNRWNLARGVSPLATNTYWRGLRAFFNDWEEFDGAPNPYKAHKAPGFQVPVPKALPRDECARVLLTATNYPRWTSFQRARAAAMFGVMLYAGLRKSEVLALVNQDVNFRTGEILVSHGKGRYGGKQRHVPISDELGRLLLTYLRERRRYHLDQAPEFFTSTRPGGGVGASTLHFIVRTIARASGVQFSAHALRHSFVTHLLRSGVPLYIARDLAGHSHVETTLIYTKVFPKDRHDSIQRLSFRR